MKYAERKEMMDQLDPDQLAGGKTPVQIADGYFRWHVLQLLCDIADSQANMAYSYKEMLTLQQKKTGTARPPAAPQNGPTVPPTQQSRYGGPRDAGGQK